MGQTDRASKRRAQKVRALDYLGGRCRYCGTAAEDTLQFVYKPGEDPGVRPSQSLTIKWERQLPELDKCYLACRSCHANGGVPTVTHTAKYTVEPLKGPMTLQQERKARLDSALQRAGEEYHAGLELEYHNARVDAGKRGLCDCDYCEDERHGVESPQAYRERAGELKSRVEDDG